MSPKSPWTWRNGRCRQNARNGIPASQNFLMTETESVHDSGCESLSGQNQNDVSDLHMQERPEGPCDRGPWNRSFAFYLSSFAYYRH